MGTSFSTEEFKGLFIGSPGSSQKSSPSESVENSVFQEMTNYEKVKEFNDAFQVKKVDTYSPDVFDTHPDVVKLGYDLIAEEVDELRQAIEDKDIVEVRDALADILYVVYGMQYKLDIDGNYDMGLVHDSNMTKLCHSEEQAQRTVENYKARFEQGESPYDSPYYEQISSTLWIVRNRSTGKVLKNIDYSPVHFDRENKYNQSNDSLNPSNIGSNTESLSESEDILEDVE